MPARLKSMAISGFGAQPITVEIDLANGLPSFQIVGLPDKAVDEARERVRAAIRNAGFQFPVHRITVNLAPADLPKMGPAYDLPIALGVLMASGTIPLAKLEDIVSIGELSLSGEIRPIHGILPMMLSLKGQKFSRVVLPAENLAEAQLVEGLPLVGANNLRQLVELLLAGELPIAPKVDSPLPPLEPLPDFSQIGGLEQVKRVLEIAAAGAHNVLLIGPPGTGKTLLARAFASILPELTTEERLDVLTIRSLAGLLRPEELRQATRPIRSPHHTASPVAVVGGGTKLRPGEVSLAHHGVLFMDELPEFPRDVLEALRQPLEEGKITIARAQGANTFPARFIFIAAANPCPCGYYGDPDKACRCAAGELQRYQKKLSGPLLDRIDLTVTVPRQAAEVLLDQPIGTPSAMLREQVIAARERQNVRYGERKTNAELSGGDLKTYVALDPSARELVLTASDKLHLSGRGIHRLIKVSQTIADLAGIETVQQQHVAEALQYRIVSQIQ